MTNKEQAYYMVMQAIDKAQMLEQHVSQSSITFCITAPLYYMIVAKTGVIVDGNHNVTLYGYPTRLVQGTDMKIYVSFATIEQYPS